MWSFIKTNKICIIKRKTRLPDYLFKIAIFLELIVMMTDYVSKWTIPYRGRITHVAFVLFVIKILVTEYDMQEYVFFVLLGMLGVISYMTCGDEYVIRVIVYLMASLKADYISVLKVVLYTTVTSVLLIVFLSLFGITGNVVDIRDYGRGVIEARYNLGFNHANNVHGVFWYIICIYFLVYKNNKKWVDCAVLTIINVVLYLLTISRTGFLLTQMIIIGVLVIRYWKWLYRIPLIQIICVPVYAIVAFVTIYGSMYNISERELVAKLDRILTGRVEVLTEHSNFKEWVLFPPPRIAELVDNGFAKIAYCYGTLIAAILAVSLIVMIGVYIYNKNPLHSMILLSAVLMTFMESTLILNTSVLCNMILIVYICGITTGFSTEKVYCDA